jgi:hypothetical protein
MTDNNLPATTGARDTAKHGTRYPVNVRAVAFTLWLENDHSFHKVHEMLQDDEHSRILAGYEDIDQPVPDVRTLRRWHQIEGWEWQMVQKMRDLLPYRQEAAAIVMADAQLPAALSLKRIASGIDIKPEDKIISFAAKTVHDIADRRGRVTSVGTNEIIDVDAIDNMEDLAEAERKLGSG